MVVASATAILKDINLSPFRLRSPLSGPPNSTPGGNAPIAAGVADTLFQPLKLF
jgi:hypothetical protein